MITPDKYLPLMLDYKLMLTRTSHSLMPHCNYPQGFALQSFTYIQLVGLILLSFGMWAPEDKLHSHYHSNLKSWKFRWLLTSVNFISTVPETILFVRRISNFLHLPTGVDSCFNAVSHNMSYLTMFLSKEYQKLDGSEWICLPNWKVLKESVFMHTA
jgi:hypothetical protein